MRFVFTKISTISMFGLLSAVSFVSHVHATKNVETSLLKTNESFRSNFNSQPNLDKGEVVMPVQASIIYIIKQSLPDFLAQIASHNKLELTLSDKVSGTLQKISLPMKIELILPELANTYGLEWHMQGRHLYVSNNLENINRLIQLGNLDLKKLKQIIARARLNPGANKMTYIEKKNSITLTGSAMYIKRVEDLIKLHREASSKN